MLCCCGGGWWWCQEWRWCWGDRNGASHSTGAWSLWGPEPGFRGKCYITVQNHGIYHKSLSVYLGGKCHGNPFPACHVTVGHPDEHAGPGRASLCSPLSTQLSTKVRNASSFSVKSTRVLFGPENFDIYSLSYNQQGRSGFPKCTLRNKNEQNVTNYNSDFT